MVQVQLGAEGDAWVRRGADGAIPACVLRGVREPTAPPAQRPLRSRLIKVILFKPRCPFGDAGVAHLHLNAGRVAAAAATEQALHPQKFLMLKSDLRVSLPTSSPLLTHHTDAHVDK